MVLAWGSSPTRLREDAATENDFVRSGYRDRLLTELAQNAADAAAKAGVAGRLAVWSVGSQLHVSNTGAPLDVAGVQALTALRASGKPGDVTGGGSVGRFGVGFTATVSVSDEIEIRSTTGSIKFSLAATEERLADDGIDVAVRPPVLRLVWPTTAQPVAGADTEVVLTLRADVDAAALLAGMATEAVDLLLELTALQSIRIGDTDFVRKSRDLAHGVEEIAVGPQRWWQYRTAHARWLAPVVDGVIRPSSGDVLRAPTRSDEELSLPAIVIADVGMQPDRRRVLPGANLADIATGYADFVAAVPISQRAALVPVPTFARGEVDTALREAIFRELRAHAWLPVVGEGAADGSARVVAPSRASVFPDLTTELAELLAEVIPALVLPELSGTSNARALAAVDVHRVGLARVAEASSGIDRPPAWWHRLYAALEPFVIDTIAVEELGALPVPLADGRLVTGPRTTVTADDLRSTGNDSPTTIPVHWARLVHPEAAHELLGRLGSSHVGATDLLSDGALRARIEDFGDDSDVSDDEATELAAAVLTLAARVADPERLPSWLGLLLLPDDGGELRSADELLLPDAPLRSVLVAQSPFGTVDAELVATYGAAALRAVGVGWGFTVVRDELPTGPDHDLDDEAQWWSSLAEDPETFTAVRDLDLVDDAKWATALTLLAGDAVVRPLLADPDSYVAWWLRRHANVDGAPLGALRHPDDSTFVGLLDPFEHVDADALRAVLAGPDRLDLELVQTLIDRLAAPERSPSAGVVADTYRRLASVVAAGKLDIGAVALSDRVRVSTGALVDPANAFVLDKPWFAVAVTPDALVAGSIETATALARLLDLPLVSESVRGVVVGTGRASSWDREPTAVLACIGLGLPLPTGSIEVHEQLRVTLRGSVEATVDVPIWVADDGIVHLRQEAL
ncbi:sacsin N-terminal ATP-binding-like domain-containing protein [Antrihabitans sp. NCIMB 15449]|uniref:Sacsin N-terminal ATP-binding-like domain-containing protein n=1 Tax=Antrihabitans spumae TaxID=3373370 RepID=A0ABW7JRH2_9NOCA